MSGSSQDPASVAVVIPTLSRPVELRRCLDSLARARSRIRFPVYVCDSSPTEAEREAVRRVCADYEWVSLSTHEGKNLPAARNACTRAAREQLLVSIDDDVQLEPEAIERLLARYREADGRRIVAGSFLWDDDWSTPQKIRPIGYSRPCQRDEKPDFVLGAFFLYPRVFACAWPWNERCDTSDDIFMGALWRSHHVQLLFAPDARAHHPDPPTTFDPSQVAAAVRHQRWHIYALLFDVLIANRNLPRALAYETLGFMASAKLYLWRPRWALPFLWSWVVGHLRLIADWRYLRAQVRREQ